MGISKKKRCFSNFFSLPPYYLSTTARLPSVPVKNSGSRNKILFHCAKSLNITYYGKIIFIRLWKVNKEQMCSTAIACQTDGQSTDCALQVMASIYRHKDAKKVIIVIQSTETKIRLGPFLTHSTSHQI
ncbi:hypothetical protein LOAG_01015 [Loa loa]|uniref:Uncharacterized protein n=1 Tax=Loa loa TaxID=7209 RepID=A0A1S0UAN6_LOALO|nr:hypothetical protein LOAG_01015 [Loa loa]EFO27467.1 hypothetical protein LOAG_01015 [Loa loa]